MPEQNSYKMIHAGDSTIELSVLSLKTKSQIIKQTMGLNTEPERRLIVDEIACKTFGLFLTSGLQMSVTWEFFTVKLFPFELKQ